MTRKTRISPCEEGAPRAEYRSIVFVNGTPSEFGARSIPRQFTKTPNALARELWRHDEPIRVFRVIPSHRRDWSSTQQAETLNLLFVDSADYAAGIAGGEYAGGDVACHDAAGADDSA